MSKKDIDFWDEVWRKYPETEIVYGTEKGKKRLQFYANLLPQKNGLLLDVGCGDGKMKPYVKNYVGLEPSKNALRNFKAVRVCAIAEHLPFKDETFNHVLACEVIEHIVERNIVLREVYRILKPKGEFIMSSPYGKEPYHISQSTPCTGHGVRDTTYIDGRFNVEYLTWLLTKNGFNITSITLLEMNNVPNNIFVTGEKQQ